MPRTHSSGVTCGTALLSGAFCSVHVKWHTFLHGYAMGGECNNCCENIWRQSTHNTVVRNLYSPGYYGVHNNPSPARNFTYMNPAYIFTPDLRTSLILLSHQLPGLHRSFLRLRFQDFMHFLQIPSPNIFIALLSRKKKKTPLENLDVSWYLSSSNG